MNHPILNIPKLKEGTAERHVILKKINYYLEHENKSVEVNLLLYQNIVYN